MPLPQPAERTKIHTRTVICEGFERADGLWDIEGHLTDIKTIPITLRDRSLSPVKPGEPIHDMSIRLTIDLDFNILDAVASMEHTPFTVCPSIADAYKQLIGLRIAPGFTKRCKQLFGGTNGCTHLLELLGPVATTAFQATHQAREARHEQASEEHRPHTLNTCHTFDSAGEVVKKYWPQYYEPDKLISSKQIS